MLVNIYTYVKGLSFYITGPLTHNDEYAFTFMHI